MKRSVFMDESSSGEKRFRLEDEDDGELAAMDISDDEWIVEDNDSSDYERDEERGESDEERGESDEERGESDEERGESDEERGESDEERGESDEDRGQIGLKDIPCNLLLKILDFTDEFDFVNFSLVSKAIHNCLKTGKYTQAEEEAVRNRLREKLETLWRKLRDNPALIAEIKDPPEDLQQIAVSSDASALRFIKNPSTKVVFKALDRLSSRAIRFVDNPTKEMQMYAFKSWPRDFQDIKNPFEEVQLAAVAYDPQFIKYIANPTKKVQLAAVEHPYGYGTIQHIKNPSNDVQFAAVRKDPYSIQYIENPSEKVQLAAVEENGYVLRFLKNSSDKVKEAAAASASQDGPSSFEFGGGSSHDSGNFGVIPVRGGDFDFGVSPAFGFGGQ